MNQNDEKSEKLVTIQLPKKSKGIMVGGGISKHGLGKLIFCIGTVDSFAYKQALEFYKQDIEALSEGNNLLYFHFKRSKRSFKRNKNFEVLAT